MNDPEASALDTETRTSSPTMNEPETSVLDTETSELPMPALTDPTFETQENSDDFSDTLDVMNDNIAERTMGNSTFVPPMTTTKVTNPTPQFAIPDTAMNPITLVPLLRDNPFSPPRTDAINTTFSELFIDPDLLDDPEVSQHMRRSHYITPELVMIMKHLKISKRLGKYLFPHLKEPTFWMSLKTDPIHIYMNLVQSLNDLDPGSGMCYIPTPTTLIQVITRLKLLRYYITQELPDLCTNGDFKPNISLALVDLCYYDSPFAAFTDNIRQYTTDHGTPNIKRIHLFLTNQDSDPIQDIWRW
jgi:hypothetical protein